MASTGQGGPERHPGRHRQPPTGPQSPTLTPLTVTDVAAITGTHIGEEYIVSRYFDLEDVFAELRIVEELEPYAIVRKQYTEDADALRRSIAHRERRGHLFLPLEDELAVVEAFERGARRIEVTEFGLGL